MSKEKNSIENKNIIATNESDDDSTNNGNNDNTNANNGNTSYGNNDNTNTNDGNDDKQNTGSTNDLNQKGQLVEDELNPTAQQLDEEVEKLKSDLNDRQAEYRAAKTDEERAKSGAGVHRAVHDLLSTEKERRDTKEKEDFEN